ncbi:NAC domain-containing protein 48-like isoform X2 [Castanea sativa]|uniref:NAC domain-containing protein 48-like isoform X2 n=1 Tax=Castanea sativa TaxID=21020 RepID=UPI003F653015
MHYLCRKCASQPIAVPIIAEIDLYKYNPWELPDLQVRLCTERKSGTSFRLETGSTRTVQGRIGRRELGTGRLLELISRSGIRSRLGSTRLWFSMLEKLQEESKTNWIMHEYRLADVDRSARKKNSLRAMVRMKALSNRCSAKEGVISHLHERIKYLADYQAQYKDANRILGTELKDLKEKLAEESR